MNDLDAIKGRIATGIYGDDRLTATEILDALAALDELVAEVERLRGEVSYLRACVPPTRPTDYGHEVWTAALRAEVAAERAAVVAWLRKEAVSHRRDGFPIAAYTMQERADAIERGEHRKEEE